MYNIVNLTLLHAVLTGTSVIILCMSCFNWHLSLHCTTTEYVWLGVYSQASAVSLV